MHLHAFTMQMWLVSSAWRSWIFWQCWFGQVCKCSRTFPRTASAAEPHQRPKTLLQVPFLKAQGRKKLVVDYKFNNAKKLKINALLHIISPWRHLELQSLLARAKRPKASRVCRKCVPMRLEESHWIWSNLAPCKDATRNQPMERSNRRLANILQD